jgi:hypothetical protein
LREKAHQALNLLALLRRQSGNRRRQSCLTHLDLEKPFLAPLAPEWVYCGAIRARACSRFSALVLYAANPILYIVTDKRREQPWAMT